MLISCKPEGLRIRRQAGFATPPRAHNDNRTKAWLDGQRLSGTGALAFEGETFETIRPYLSFSETIRLTFFNS